MQDLALWICLPDLDITKSDIMVDTTKSDIVMVDQAGQKKGWTGFTWDKRLFPDPEQFIAKLHSLGLKVTLNLHPASGVQPWEDSYQTVAELMGIDPSSERYVPMRMTHKPFAEVWLNHTLGQSATIVSVFLVRYASSDVLLRWYLH
eukprot:3735036-Rhodomonas_salina.2